MTILFYCADRASLPEPAALPAGVRARFWRPAVDGWPPAGPRRAENGAWWLLDRIGAFASREFVELGLWESDRPVHRLIVTPRWYRFPFMGRGDLQLGALWTAPQARGRGLARAALGLASHHAAERADRLWYVVDASNVRSIGVLRSSGYRLAGEGRRTVPFGLRAFGRYEIEAPPPHPPPKGEGDRA